eukprot:s672_g12.t1
MGYPESCAEHVLGARETDTEPEHWQGGVPLHSLLFLQCPASFQLQALNFYQRVALTLLLHSPHLPAKVLETVAPAFARAGLLEAVPFDLLKPSTADFFGAAASAPPPEPPLATSLALTTPYDESKDGLLPDTGAAETMSLMEFWLEELSFQEGGSSSSSRPACDSSGGLTRPAYLLAKYAKLLPGNSSSTSLERLPSVPGVVLDPLLRKMGAVLRDSAQNLSFEELAETLATLADAGIRPTDVWEALTEAAEARDFPSVQTPKAAEQVAALLYGFSGRSATRLQDRLDPFLAELGEVSATKLGLRPLQTAARLLAWPSSSNRQRTRLRRYLLHIRGCSVLLIALSIGSFAAMMADGTLVNTHLRAARCVNNDFHRDNPSDCNGMVVSFPTVVLISTVLCFATLASLLWIAMHLVDSNPCRAVHDISTMLVIFNVIKVTFMCLHGMFIAMTWYSELTDTRILGFALIGADLTQILISGWIWLKLLQMQQVCTESELTWTKLRALGCNESGRWSDRAVPHMDTGRTRDCRH